MHVVHRTRTPTAPGVHHSRAMLPPAMQVVALFLRCTSCTTVHASMFSKGLVTPWLRCLGAWQQQCPQPDSWPPSQQHRPTHQHSCNRTRVRRDARPLQWRPAPKTPPLNPPYKAPPSLPHLDAHCTQEEVVVHLIHVLGCREGEGGGGEAAATAAAAAVGAQGPRPTGALLGSATRAGSTSHTGHAPCLGREAATLLQQHR